VLGFVSANLHVNFDRTQVVNYAQWKGREAIAAARENPKVVAFMREQFQIADSFTPIQHTKRSGRPSRPAFSPFRVVIPGRLGWPQNVTLAMI
jgi:hypothetical protein